MWILNEEEERRKERRGKREEQRNKGESGKKKRGCWSKIATFLFMKPDAFMNFLLPKL